MTPAERAALQTGNDLARAIGQAEVQNWSDGFAVGYTLGWQRVDLGKRVELRLKSAAQVSVHLREQVPPLPLGEEQIKALVEQRIGEERKRAVRYVATDQAGHRTVIEREG